MEISSVSFAPRGAVARQAEVFSAFVAHFELRAAPAVSILHAT
jgi:hypothetical protein